MNCVKSNKIAIFAVIYIILSIAIGINLVVAACVVPTEDLIITQSTTLCSGTYNLADTNKNGAINIGADNIVLTCNGTKLIGNNISNSYAIGFNFHNNATIQGCYISKYDVGIYSAHGTNNKVLNNSIIKTNVHAIRFLENNNAIISRNFINNSIMDRKTGTYGDNTYTYGNGIYLSSSNGVYTSNIIEYNKIDLVRYGIRINANMIQTKIRYNNISNIGSWQGYALIIEEGVTNNCEIYGNRIINGGWDAIVVRSSNNVIRDNYIDSFYHHGYDSLCVDNDYEAICANSNKFYNNYIIDQRLTDPEYDAPSACIYINQEINSNFYNNTCVSGVISSTGSPQQTYGNKIYNNYVLNAPGNALYILSPADVYNNRIKNTILFKQDMYDVTVGSDYLNKSWYTQTKFTNNIFEDGYALYYFIKSNSNISIDELAPFAGSFDYGGSFNFTYSGVKKFRIVGTKLYIYNQLLQFPYNDVYDLSAKKIIASNINNYSITLNIGVNIAIGNYNNSKLPPVTITLPPLTPIITANGVFNSTSRFINCSFSIYDTDSSLLNVSLQWFKNNVLNSTVNYVNKPNTSKIVASLNTTVLFVNDYWQCKARVYDGKNYSLWGSSQIITVISTIINSVPTATMSLTTSSKIINCSAIVFDANSDLINGRMSWYKNNVFNYTNFFYNAPSGSKIQHTLNSSLYIFGDTWDCRVLLNDSKNSSEWFTSTKILLNSSFFNSPPSAVVALKVSGYAINCSATVSDLDSDLINGRFSWFKNNVLNYSNFFYNKSSTSIVQSTLNRALYNMGDSWDCRVLVDDSKVNVGWFVSSKIIINSSFFNTTTNNPPEKPIVNIYSFDNLGISYINCSTFIYDKNDNMMSGQFAWYKNDLLNYSNFFYNKTSGTNIKYTLNKSLVAIGDIWDCRVRLYDGMNYSVWGLSDKMKINPPPKPDPIPDPTPTGSKNGGGGGSGGASMYTAYDLNQTSSANITASQNYSIITVTPIDSTPIQPGTIILTSDVPKSTDVETEIPQRIEPTIETPGIVISNAPKKSSASFMIILGMLVALALTFVFFKTKTTKLRDDITNYIINSLYQGYDYTAITDALQKKLDNKTTDKHIRHVQSQGLKPIVRYNTPQKIKLSKIEKEKLVNSLKLYIVSQNKAGFDFYDIRNTLLRYGHSYDVVDESFDMINTNSSGRNSFNYI